MSEIGVSYFETCVYCACINLENQRTRMNPLPSGTYDARAEHATNDGFPSVADSFNVPGEEGYTAIWNYDNHP